MLKCLDKELIQSIILKYGMDIKKLNLSNNGKVTMIAWMYVCVDVCVCGCMYGWIYLWMYVWMYCMCLRVDIHTGE